ncbi:TrbG/VirB9 family P-type conjugative transfer protein [Asticcacaulis sp. YBE204]|uniref:TrbG/VirB9 family P-type conjugative transfer protein n=1 Tax=Asticcacaulis sp. YBE204 TaxID=1282363 RepID=UPI0003C3E605|nr:TrbG/VirB9 family P-type conjugative transfer protein [Asticcacaulis sp. YBE204]ESQ79277.1 hypothetical protein AEYBE204_09720 [Asticcacaulis sp. YBE204]
MKPGPFITAATVASLLSVAYADEPVPSGRDVRVVYMDYHAEAVAKIDVKRGFVSRVVLEDGETIVSAATGLTADCQSPDSQWCVRADEGTGTIWIKPKAGATRNNLELRTDRRDYSLEFQVVTAKPVRNRKGKVIRWTSPEPMYRVIYRYPAVSLAPGKRELDLSTASARLLGPKPQRPVPRNWAYSMQMAPRSEGIAPSLTFDDGRFTYFRFANNRDVPTLYRITPAGEEERLNFHMDGELVVVQRTAERFILRLGDMTVGVWNDAFDPDGVPPNDGTTLDGMRREEKGGGQ